MQNLIKTTIYLVASLLLLSCLSSYADEEKATYYTFVMYKAPNKSKWQLPSYPIKPGSYRFQIVYMNPHDEDHNLPWIALRGEFEFVYEDVNNKIQGVKAINKYTLDQQTADANNPEPNTAFSLWSINSWKKEGPKWVQPLIVQMNKLRKDAGKAGGTQNPNFIRFLIRQKKLEDIWNYKNKQYHIYRLHYLKDQLSQEKKIEIISRFIQPSQTPINDITRLKGWVDQQKSGFTSAFYLGKPDDKHQNFFQDFKKIFYKKFNLTQSVQPSSLTTETNNQNKVITDNTDWLSILLAILFVLIIAIISIAVYFEKELKLLIKSKKTNYKPDDKYSDNEQTQPAADPKRDQDNRESAIDNSKYEFDELKKELQQEISNELVTAKKELQKNSYNTQVATPEIDYTQLVEIEVKKYLNKNLNTYLKSYLEPYIKNKPTSDKTLHNKINDIQAYTTTTSKPPQKPTDNTITQIKTLLLSNKSVDDEAALNSLNTNVDPFMFITSVVGNCLKLNQPLTHYQRLNDAIKNLTNNKVSLLIPSVGDDVNTVEHNVVGQQTVSKGKLNVVASLIRPGVKSDGVIKRKAEVVQNV